MDELGSSCLAPGWSEYVGDITCGGSFRNLFLIFQPYALAFCMFSVFCIFVVELVAFRWGTSKLARLGVQYGQSDSVHHFPVPMPTYDSDAHGHDIGSHAAHGPEAVLPEEKKVLPSEHGHAEDLERQAVLDNAAAQIIGVAILEFGVLLHRCIADDCMTIPVISNLGQSSILIGLTLAVVSDFKILFVVIIFHRTYILVHDSLVLKSPLETFEGLGIGSRLAYLNLPARYGWVPYVGSVLYGVTTPIGIAVGLGVKSTYNPGSTTASIVSGVLDAISSGILLYTGLVEVRCVMIYRHKPIS